MRYLSFILLFFCIFSTITSQERKPQKTRAADKAFSEFSYEKAASLYESYLPSKDSIYIFKQLSLTYMKLNNMNKAEKYLKRTVRKEGVDPIYYYHYAEALTSTGQYEEAEQWYQKYDAYASDDRRLANKIGAINNIERFFIDSLNYRLEKSSFNSNQLDFSPTYYKNGIVFVSSRKTSSTKVKATHTVSNIYNWDKTPFLDLYFSDGTSDKVEKFSRTLNSVYHEGPAAFFQNDQRVVFTRNNFDKGQLGRDGEGVTRLKLFFSDYDQEKEKWSDPVAFQYNSTDYSVGHPTITEDGKVLIFSSDMPGGEGMSDLYISNYENGEWSTPLNLGTKVNTEGRESFPFMVGDQLFFASDGLGGLGGLDLFQVIFEGDTVQENPKNLGYPVNSERDDFGLITVPNLSDGYFTTARNEDSKDDIYYFERFIAYLEIEVLDAVTGLPIPGAQLAFVQNELPIGDYVTNASGSKKIQVGKSNNYSISATMNGYEPGSATATTTGIADGESIKRQIRLQPHLPEPALVDLVAFVNVSGTEQAFIEEDGVLYELMINEKQLWLQGKDSSIYLEYYPFSKDSTMIRNATSAMKLQNRSIRNVTIINSIFYDLNKYDIREDAMSDLNKVKNLMERHPSTRLYLESHTDSRGSNAYNEKLAKNRALAAQKYLAKNGISEERVEMGSLGERKLLNNCTNGQACDEASHQTNRRTELKLILIKKGAVTGQN